MSRTEERFECRACEEVNARIRADEAAFVEEEEARYRANVERVASTLASRVKGCCPVLLCGPSSVGKTTTARRLCAALERQGVASVVVSLDDFYRGLGNAPRLPDGRHDYESPEALDLVRLHRCVEELMQTGQTRLPIYDFQAGRPSDRTRSLVTAGDTAVIFEGVHAFTPSVTETVSMGREVPRVFVNTGSRFLCGDETVLLRRDVRLARRLLRDERTRASSFHHTMTMWDQVLYGTETYILPYVEERDLTVDTTLGYEPSVMAAPLLARLSALDGTPYEAEGRRLCRAFRRFEPLPLSIVPPTSVLTEFLGNCDFSCV
ncbi:MAG: AAA family ATPase [Clostridia bacterium]|nr:AAA family ATPase [Clostridia bacterium]